MFDEIKRIVARNTLLLYSDFNKRLNIHTDASDFHLVSVIIQDDKPIDFYIRNLTGPQIGYIVIEKGFISIVETLKGFHTFWLGQQLNIYTDKKI